MNENKIENIDELTHIDLFAGCGGLSLGLHNTGWKGLFAIEKNADAFKTLSYNLIENNNQFTWPEWLPRKNHNINSVIKLYAENLKSLRGKVTLVTGGPPCQGFSLMGERNEEDERNKLIDSYISFIELVRPKLLFFENVKGFTLAFKKDNPKARAYSEYVINKLTDLGYNVHGQILDFADFGVPQNRHRFILVGCLHASAELFFKKIVENKKRFFLNKKLNENNTLGDAISDLLEVNGLEPSPDTKGFMAGKYAKPLTKYQEVMRGEKFKEGDVADSHRYVNHKAETVEKFAYLIKHARKIMAVELEHREKFESKKKIVHVLSKSKASPTLTTLPDDYIHYCEPRILTVREYARIQSFPDSFQFKGKYTTGGKLRKKEVPRYTQIGNAIPPLFGEQSGLVLKELVKNGKV